MTENISYDKLLNSGMYEYIGKAEPEKEQSAPVKPEKPVTSSVSGGVLIFAICCEKEWPHHLTRASLSILSDYDVIMTDSDTKQTSDTYEATILPMGFSASS